MSLISRMKRQKAVYWKRLSNTLEGHSTFETPVIILCRWEDKTQTFLDKQGNEQVSNTQVYLDPEYLVLGSALKKVPDDLVRQRPKLTDAEILAEMALNAAPYKNKETWEIRQTADQVNLRNTETLAWVLL